MRPISAAGIAMGGIHREMDRFERKAAEVTALATTADGLERVDVSSAARKASETPDGVLSSDMQSAMVDLRVAKYGAIANMKVLETANEMARELGALAGSEKRGG